MAMASKSGFPVHLHRAALWLHVRAQGGQYRIMTERIALHWR
jgi:hypothetical protein